MGLAAVPLLLVCGRVTTLSSILAILLQLAARKFLILKARLLVVGWPYVGEARRGKGIGIDENVSDGMEGGKGWLAGTRDRQSDNHQCENEEERILLSGLEKTLLSRPLFLSTATCVLFLCVVFCCS